MLASSPTAGITQQYTTDQLRQELMRSAIEGLQRQRMEQRRYDQLLEELQAQQPSEPPDLSSFGTPVDKNDPVVKALREINQRPQTRCSITDRTGQTRPIECFDR